MGWIHELVHSVALLNDYTYQLNHITVPRLYTVLMGWIHELVHSIALLNDYTYQLNHITVPRLLDWAKDRDYFRATLQLFRVTERTISDAIQFASAVVAHAIRMIRVVEAHQLLLVLHEGVGVITNDDQQYAKHFSGGGKITATPSWSP
ncbi:unnamed protein product [Heligmosomoides polygyrus]|uniref:Uncharacterized protein n=1 Tax=Heligmosomoides polygyrus TaxID=6339 RepID=A0A183GXP0_HELPZ|nr:unnamed protein product [Heligmosomoides polygyrus]